MDERMLRLMDFMDSHLESPARCPAEKAQEQHRAKYPFQHSDESLYRFNLRMNAYKTPDQILTEIERNGAGDYYLEHKEVARRSYPSGDIYVQAVQEMRLGLRTRQLTEPVIVALLDHGVPLNMIYDALSESDQASIFTKPIALAAGRGTVENVKTLRQLYLGGFRWQAFGHHFDHDVMLVILGNITRPEFLEIFCSDIALKTFGQLIDECKAMVRAGQGGNLRSRGHVLEDDVGM